MNIKPRSPIDIILRLMNEDPMIGGATTNLTGAGYAQNAQDVYQDLGSNELAGFKSANIPVNELPVNETYTEKEVKIAKRFMHLIGDRDRARRLIDKVIAADDLIGVEDNTIADQNNIEKIASLMPSEVDHPTDYSPAFNPSSYR